MWRSTIVREEEWVPRRRQYGCLGFLGDVFMFCITGGLWLIWIFVREMRRR